MARPAKAVIQQRNELFLEGLYLCGTCWEVKPLLAFPSHKSNRHKVSVHCKECKNATNRAINARRRAEMGEDAFLALKREQLNKWKKNTRPKRIDHFKRKEREQNYKQNYGITIEDFDRMLAEQDGRCAICMTPKPQRKWHVDHCHGTNEVRGILCNLCNVGLGAFKDSQEALKAAEIYLRPRGTI